MFVGIPHVRGHTLFHQYSAAHYAAQCFQTQIWPVLVFLLFLLFMSDLQGVFLTGHMKIFRVWTNVKVWNWSPNENV